MVGGLKGIARRPYNGDTREGPRHSYILNELRRRGCEPEVDQYGNIWVVKGAGRKTVLFSSHLDVDPRIRKIEFRAEKEGRRTVVSGILDNAIGCYLNLLLAQDGPRKGKAIYVFTASEEIDRKSGTRWARSAREVLRELRRRKMTPDLCVAIDVTYPRLRKAQEKLDWKRSYGELFDVNDKTHCYLDGFSREQSRRIGLSLLSRARDPNVGIRRFHGHDEAFIYDRISPSFAFGPVVFGHFDRPGQTTPLAHIRTALKFLRCL
jgi:putative aminopeptidase FrvX